MTTATTLIVTQSFTDADAALAHATTIYNSGINHLRQSLHDFVAGQDKPGRIRACYPFVRVRTDTVARADSRLSYGFVAGPGTYETTLTRPDLFANYYREQFQLLLRNHGGVLEVGMSKQPIPIHFSFAQHDHVEGTMSAERRQLMRDVFDLPDLAAMDDGIANGTHEPGPREAQPLALFTAPRVDYSLQRLRHYTGTSPEQFQNFVLFTNYQFYIDEFVRLGHEMMAKPLGQGGLLGNWPKHAAESDDYIAFVEPGNVVTRRAGVPAQPEDGLGVPPPRLPQMPAYHLVRADGSGITMVNIGVGPANAKNISDHIAVLRPHAWLMLGHCAGLRNTQQLGDYVLAHGYVREDHVLDEELPLWVPIPPLAEVQQALERAVADEEDHAHRHRGQHRQPQLGTAAAAWPRAPLQPEPGGGTRHGIGHHRGQRLPLPRALRHLALRLGQTPARRDQAARHGQRVLPRAGGPAPAHRHARHRAAAPPAPR